MSVNTKQAHDWECMGYTSSESWTSCYVCSTCGYRSYLSMRDPPAPETAQDVWKKLDSFSTYDCSEYLAVHVHES